MDALDRKLPEMPFLTMTIVRKEMAISAVMVYVCTYTYEIYSHQFPIHFMTYRYSSCLTAESAGEEVRPPLYRSST